MNYRRYYSGPEKILAKSYSIKINGYLKPNDNEIILSQYLHVRAVNTQEAYDFSQLIRDDRLNCLHTITTVSDIHENFLQVWTTDPNEPLVNQSATSDTINAYSIKIIREPGSEPLTGIWSDYAEDHLTVHAIDEQEAHLIANYVSQLRFRGQIRRTFVNGREHFDKNY